MSNHSCRFCKSHDLKLLIDFGPRPITKNLLESSDEEVPLFPIKCYACQHCGLVQIATPIPEHELYSNYKLESTWKFQPHIEDELQQILSLEDIDKERLIVEIGCNDGIVLNALKDKGYENLLGVEPSTDVAQAAQKKGLEVINDFWNLSKALEIKEQYGQAQLIISRQVFEHISDIDGFMRGVYEQVAQDGYLLFEVPDFEIPISFGDLSTFWEEHVNYFTEETLSNILKYYGFSVLQVIRYDFSGGALTVIAKKDSIVSMVAKPCNSATLAKLDAFPKTINQFVNKIKGVVEKYDKKEIAIYGAGNRTVILLNYFLSDYVRLVVDDQKEKQNFYLPMPKLLIQPSSKILENKIKLCLLAVNAESENKVLQNNRAFIKQGGKFSSIFSPSKYLFKEVP